MKETNDHRRIARLRAEHHPSQIAARLAARKEPVRIGDFVLGSIDGCVTSFAIISAAHGIGLPANLVIILGLANLLADGFSMAVSNYQNVQTEADQLERLEHEERDHIRLVPEGEKEELRQIYASKGLHGALLEEVVNAISSNKDAWVATMLREEHQIGAVAKSPVQAALVTFVAFAVFGGLPLLPLAFADSPTMMVYAQSAGIAAIAFFCIGMLKARIADKPRVLGGLRVMFIGLSAAALALTVGLAGNSL